MPLLSIILPIYNVKNYLERCYESIILQNYDDFEILLVDDGSNDGSSDLCDLLSIQAMASTKSFSVRVLFKYGFSIRPVATSKKPMRLTVP